MARDTNESDLERDASTATIGAKDNRVYELPHKGRRRQYHEDTSPREYPQQQ